MGKIIMKLILNKGLLGLTLVWSGSGWGQEAGCCECGDEPLDSIQCGEFLD